MALVSWLSSWSAMLCIEKVVGLIPGHGRCLSCGFSPWSECIPEAGIQCFSFTLMLFFLSLFLSLSLLLSLPPLLFPSLKAMKKCPQVRIFKKFKEIWTSIFSVSLLTTANIWKQPRYPSIDEWIKMMWHIYWMKYYSAIKNELLPLVTTQMDLNAKWQELDRERHLYNFTYMWKLKK